MCMLCAGIAVILLALAAGYIVLLKADKAEGKLKKIGKIIGWVIVVVAALSLLWTIKMSMFCAVKGGSGYGRRGMCGMHGKMSMKKDWKDKKCEYMKKHKSMGEDAHTHGEKK